MSKCAKNLILQSVCLLLNVREHNAQLKNQPVVIFFPRESLQYIFNISSDDQLLNMFWVFQSGSCSWSERRHHTKHRESKTSEKRTWHARHRPTVEPWNRICHYITAWYCCTCTTLTPSHPAVTKIEWRLRMLMRKCGTRTFFWDPLILKCLKLTPACPKYLVFLL